MKNKGYIRYWSHRYTTAKKDRIYASNNKVVDVEGRYSGVLLNKEKKQMDIKDKTGDERINVADNKVISELKKI